MSEKLNVAVLPAGAWGTAFAKVAGEKGYNVNLYFRSSDAAEVFNSEHINYSRLSGIKISENVTAINDIEETVSDVDILVLAPPSRFLRELYLQVFDYVNRDTPILSLTKGLEEGTNLRASQMLKQIEPEISSRLAVLSGPNFAEEIARGLPAFSVVASEDEELAELMQKKFSTPRFRIYTQDDVTGVELGGAFKNVIAIAAGASDGLGMGENARAGLVTRGLEEIKRLGVALGGKEPTFDGLAGQGDLWLTSTSSKSRNHEAGVAIARGVKPEELRQSGRTIEGFYTARAMVELAKDFGMSLPIAEAVYHVVYEGLSVKEAIVSLENRPLTTENVSLH